MSGGDDPRQAPAMFLRTAQADRPGTAALLSAISGSEAELCRRLDALEIIAMETHQALTSGGSGAVILPDLQGSLEAALDRIASLGGARARDAMAERAALAALHKALGMMAQRFGAALDRLDRLATLPAAAVPADAAAPGDLPRLLDMLEETAARLDTAIARFEDMAPPPDIAQAVAAALDGRAAPDPGLAAGLRAEIAAAGDRIARLVGTQHHGFEAERQRLGRFIAVLEAAVPRLEAALADRPGEDRIAALEAALRQASDRHAAAQAETLEAVRDMGMVVAEMLARHERGTRDAAESVKF